QDGRHERPADVHRGAPGHRSGVRPEVGTERRRVAHPASWRVRRPRAAMTKKISVHCTNEKAANVSIPAPKPAHAAAHAAIRSLASPVSCRALRTSRTTAPQMNQTRAARPRKPIDTSEFRYWSSKMIGAPVFGSVIVPG